MGWLKTCTERPCSPGSIPPTRELTAERQWNKHNGTNPIVCSANRCSDSDEGWTGKSQWLSSPPPRFGFLIAIVSVPFTGRVWRKIWFTGYFPRPRCIQFPRLLLSCIIRSRNIFVKESVFAWESTSHGQIFNIFCVESIDRDFNDSQPQVTFFIVFNWSI